MVDFPSRGGESRPSKGYGRTIHPRDAKVEPDVAGLTKAMELEGCEIKLPGMFEQADTSQYSETPKHTVPAEGGATWLGKGSSKTPFPV